MPPVLHPTRRARSTELGLILRGCCLGLLLVILVLASAGFVTFRAVAGPVLGDAPRGPSHGESERAIAVSLASQLARQLAALPHAVVILSEHDLTVIGTEHNPHPDRYREVALRTRDGVIVVSAVFSYGPFSPTGVARVGVALDSSNGQAHFTAAVRAIDVGQLGMPWFVKDRLAADANGTVALDSLLVNASLQAVRGDIECVVVGLDGVRIGVHRPGVVAEPAVCGA